MFKINCINDFDITEDSKDREGAIIYASINGVAFPGDDWFDLPISVLSMWCWVIEENYKKEQVEFELDFMDGPYYIKCYKDG